MNATHPYNQILLASWRQRDRDAAWSRWLLAAFGVALLAVWLHFAPGWRPQVLVAAAVAVLCGQWLVTAGNLLQQNHPHAARFVPGQVHRLRVAALAMWGGLSLATAGLAWGFVPRMPAFATVLLLMAAVLAFAAWALRTWFLWLVVSFAPGLFFGLGLQVRLAPLGHALQALWQAQTPALLALGLGVLGWSIARLFGDGDDAHRERYACQQRRRRLAQTGPTGQGDAAAVFGRPGEWLAAPFKRAAAAWLRHTLRVAAPTKASVLQRAEVVLHGQEHWVRQLVMGLLILAVIALALGVTFSLVPVSRDFLKGLASGMAFGLSSAGFNPGFALPGVLWRSRREQALLRLLPGMPQGQALNRSVAWLQLRHALLAGGVTSAVLAALAVAAGDPGLMCLPLGALPLGTLWLLRAPARMRSPSASSPVAPLVLYMLLGWGMYAVHAKLHVPMAALAAASLGSTAALGLWRWRALVAAPAALPAGRLA